MKYKFKSSWFLTTDYYNDLKENAINMANSTVGSFLLSFHCHYVDIFFSFYCALTKHQVVTHGSTLKQHSIINHSWVIT